MAADVAHDSEHGTYHVFVADTEGLPRVTGSSDKDKERRKRPHHKSRQGCITCKRRRVKCDYKIPCSNCAKRKEACVQPKLVVKSGAKAGGDAITHQSANPPSAVVDDTAINLFHMEIFHHFQTNIIDTLSFREIWPQIIQWSFQEPYIMSAILCLSATHLSATRPEPSRYSRIALQLLTKSAALLGEKLSGPIETHSVEKLIGASILMQYIAWSHIEFLVQEPECSGHGTPDGLDFSQDPLFRLSSGIKDLFFEAFPALWGSPSVFLSTSLYSPRLVIEQSLAQHGLDPGAHVAHFMRVWDDPRFQSSPRGPEQEQPPSQSSSLARFEVFLYSDEAPCGHSVKQQLSSMVTVFKILTCRVIKDSPSLPREHDIATRPHPEEAESPSTPTQPQSDSSDAQRRAFQFVSRGVSIALCLASLSSAGPDEGPSDALSRLQPDIERYFFSLPIICAGTFRDLAFRGDARALVVLLHFYRAARVLLTGPQSWWACERSRVLESLILRDLTAKGLEAYAWAPGWEASQDASAQPVSQDRKEGCQL